LSCRSAPDSLIANTAFATRQVSLSARGETVPAATPAPPPAVVDEEAVDTDASSPQASTAGSTEMRPTPSGALTGLSQIVGAVAPVNQPALASQPGLAAVNASVEALRQPGAVPALLTLAQVVASMEATVCDLCVLQSSGDLSGEMASRQEAWERDLRACQEELR
jgi:hypothetical protein